MTSQWDGGVGHRADALASCERLGARRSEQVAEGAPGSKDDDVADEARRVLLEADLGRSSPPWAGWYAFARPDLHRERELAVDEWRAASTTSARVVEDVGADARLYLITRRWTSE